MPRLLLFLLLCVSVLAAAPAQAYQDKCDIKAAVRNDSDTGKNEAPGIDDLFYVVDIDELEQATGLELGLSQGDAIEMDQPIPSTSAAFQSPDLINCRAINWTIEERRRACLARIVSHVYSREKKAIPLSPDTGFRLHGEPLEDGDDVYAAIYEYVGQGREDKSAPHLIVAFRGTDLCWKRRGVRDVWFDCLITVDAVKYTGRFKLAYQKLVHLMLDNPGRPVWLTGHSAGASLALHVGTHMVLKKEIKLPTFAFNPPVAILGWFPVPKGVKKLIGPLIPSRRKQSLKLCRWTPVLYVHQRDFFFCRRIIDCLKKPTKLDKWIINLPSLTMCENSAIVQAGGEQCGLHSIKQWFSPNSELNMTCRNIQENRKHTPEALSRFSLGYASNGLHAIYQGYEFPLFSSDVPQAP
ncbi:hypothetical protein CFC21_073411 [Triticum aestivum]|uniref:Fungal lipase-like domain-containing protein n=2 Tax=Triticum aestivum TaxID=4565 RepID=A0A3B6LSU1_WHEAT|nr:uncharacterized protein LOC123116926 [Triticum aestivum]KAF7067524.1 hypothetical protein CFC21_073411 [Triticum aestivum]